jgi:hypothetical protein
MPIIVKTSPAVGTKIRFIESRSGPDWAGNVKDVTPGRIYVIAGIESDDSYFFYDDAGDRNYSAISDGAGDFELVQ